MKANDYVVLCRAVEEGIAYGLSRAEKHVDHPPREYQQECLELAIINAICEVFTFPDSTLLLDETDLLDEEASLDELASDGLDLDRY